MKSGKSDADKLKAAAAAGAQVDSDNQFLASHLKGRRATVASDSDSEAEDAPVKNTAAASSSAAVKDATKATSSLSIAQRQIILKENEKAKREEEAKREKDAADAAKVEAVRIQAAKAEAARVARVAEEQRIAREREAQQQAAASPKSLVIELPPDLSASVADVLKKKFEPFQIQGTASVTTVVPNTAAAATPATPVKPPATASAAAATTSADKGKDMKSGGGAAQASAATSVDALFGFKEVDISKKPVIAELIAIDALLQKDINKLATFESQASSGKDSKAVALDLRVNLNDISIKIQTAIQSSKSKSAGHEQNLQKALDAIKTIKDKYNIAWKAFNKKKQVPSLEDCKPDDFKQGFKGAFMSLLAGKDSLREFFGSYVLPPASGASPMVSIGGYIKMIDTYKAENSAVKKPGAVG